DDEGNVITTKEETAEKFLAETLLYPKKKSSFRSGMGSGSDESVTIYGIIENSDYITLGKDAEDGKVYISSAFSKKFHINEGENITLHAEYENRTYDFDVAGVIDYDGGIAIFMKKDAFLKKFDKDKDEFSGFFSRNEIRDIDEQYIATKITSEEITKVTVQLRHSFGAIIDVFKYALIVMAAALIYLLAKIIIERNENAISMSKILGFKNSEIGSLYIIPTAFVVLLCAVIGFIGGMYLMIWIFGIFVQQLDGYFAFYMTPLSMVLSVVYLLVGYAFVSVIDYHRIKRIPLGVALKNVE
ncbi:MAG: ABC transporter permease, partial [Lachnospiraceae bacterium]|nr:ABC transporter permease [Lachnospiraceae bacterium]